MFKKSLRVRLLLPVLALVIAVVVALTWVLASAEAHMVRADTRHMIQRETSGLQSLLAVSRDIMLDRVHDGMRLLRQESQDRGLVTIGPEVRVGAHQVPDLLLGNQPLAKSTELVDHVAAIMESTATLFSRSGDDFVRISTNVQQADGSRATGTELDSKGAVAERLREGNSFYGIVDILDQYYVTGYEPIFAGVNQDKAVGAWYVGYRADMQALRDVISESRVMDSGFMALLDASGDIHLHSSTGLTTDEAAMLHIIKNRPKDWEIIEEEVPGWGFKLVAAYPDDDVNAIIRQQSIWIICIGVAVGAALLGMLAWLIWTRVLQPVQHLTQVAEELSLGRFNHTIPEVGLEDEIGTLARAIARLSNSVRLAMERLSRR